VNFLATSRVLLWQPLTCRQPMYTLPGSGALCLSGTRMRLMTALLLVAPLRDAVK
jgi:hypothetical protein